MLRRDTQEAIDDFFPGYAHTMTEIGKERGWPKMTRASFDAQRGPQGALLVGNPDEVVEKIIRHSKALRRHLQDHFYDEPRLITSCKTHASYQINRYTYRSCTS